MTRAAWSAVVALLVATGPLSAQHVVEGRVVGVTIGGSERRGTVLTAAPVSIREVVARADAELAPGPGPNFRPSPSQVVAYGDALRRRLTVAKVVCLAKPPQRRPLSTR